MNILAWVFNILFIASCNFLLAVEVQEQKIWQPAEEPKTYQEARDLYEKSEKEQKRAQEILDDKRANKDAKEQALLDQERAERDKTVAELGMVDAQDGGWGQMLQNNIVSKEDNPENFVSRRRDNLNQSNKKILTDMNTAIEATKNKLASTTTVIHLGNTIDDLSNQLQQTIAMFDISQAQEDKGQINDILRKINNSIDNVVEAAKREVNEQTTILDKLDIIRNQRDKLTMLRDIVDRKLRDITIKNDSRYQAQLNNLINTIERKIGDFEGKTEDLTKESIAKRGKTKPESWLSRQLSNFKDWFDRTFDFHKETSRKRSIEDEIKNAKKIQDTYKGEVQIILDVANTVEAADKAIKEYDKPDKSKAAKEKHLNEVNNSLTKLEAQINQIPQDAQAQLNTMVNNLNLLQADLGFKEKRYRGDYPTLFDAQLDEYATQFKGAPKTVRVIDAYKILKLQGDPEKITKEAIDAAGAKEMANFKKGSPEFEAARQAHLILSPRASRINYDAFLKDYNALLAQGLTEAQIRNPDKSSEIQNFLKGLNALPDGTKSESAKIEISKKLYDQINDAKIFAVNIQQQINQEGITILQTLETERAKIQDFINKNKSAQPESEGP